MSYMRISPPSVTQSNTWWCWAACLEILSRAHPERFQRPLVTQSAWVDLLRQSPVGRVAVNTQGGINMQYLGRVITALGMHGHVWNGPPSSIPDIAVIEEKLRISYLLAVYTVPGGSHFVVIYGVDDTRVHYFNPYQGIGNTSATHAEIRANRLIIGWKPQ